MKNVKIVMLIVGVVGFIYSCYNIIFVGLSNQWFGFIAGAFLIWLFFNIDKFIEKSKK